MRQYLNVADTRRAMARLGIDVTGRTIRRWCAEGRLEAMRLGRRYFIPTTELTRFILEEQQQ